MKYPREMGTQVSLANLMAMSDIKLSSKILFSQPATTNSFSRLKQSFCLSDDYHSLPPLSPHPSISHLLQF